MKKNNEEILPNGTEVLIYIGRSVKCYSNEDKPIEKIIKGTIIGNYCYEEEPYHGSIYYEELRYKVLGEDGEIYERNADTFDPENKYTNDNINIISIDDRITRLERNISEAKRKIEDTQKKIEIYNDMINLLNKLKYEKNDKNLNILKQMETKIIRNRQKNFYFD